MISAPMTQSPGAFVAAAVVLIVTPGPDTALTLRNALRGGRRSGIATAVGVSFGQAVWALAAAAGLASLLTTWSPEFFVLRCVGASYLIFLGQRSLGRALVKGVEAPETDRPAMGISAHRSFLQGLISNLSNPKVAVFFVTVVPTFSRRTEFLPTLKLDVIAVTMTCAWLCVYAAVAGRERTFIDRPSVRRTIDAVAGCALLGFGLRMASESL